MIKGRLVGLLSHAKKYIVYNVLWQWISLLAQMMAVFTIADLLEQVLFSAVDAGRFQRALAVLAAAIVIRFVCERMASRASCMASVDVKRILREKIYEKLLKLGAAYRDQVSTSEVVQVCAEGVEQLETYFGRYLPQLFYSLLAPLTLFAVLAFVNLKASIVLLICVPLIPISIVVVQKIAKKLLSKYWGIYTELGDSFLENLQGLTTLKIYQADEQKAEEMDEESQRFRQITMKVLTMQLNSTSVMDIVAYGGAAIGMIVAASEFLKGNLDFSGTLVIILLASEFFIPLRLLGSFFHIAMNGMAASDKIFRLLDLPEPETGGETLPKENLDIRFSDVHFSYEENREILKGVSLKLPAGSFVSLVGESGCGKSTIAGLLAGKNRGYSGGITIGGKNISDVREANLMKNVTLIRHNSYLFKGTVEENLKMAKPDATEKEMKAVLEKVNLLSFLETQGGLKTLLLEKAGNFSGGQCQRLALARALLHDSPVYIFDEATSNIDAESEELIMEVIRELAKTKTVLLISHRLSNVVGSDRIYMLADGEICQQGTHEELMEENGPYRHLFESQKALEQYGRNALRMDEERVVDDSAGMGKAVSV
ncbi:MAG: ABC transporter ATP-binding protein/permease [Eubacteriales bacterium]|nr:ABC transporter ATP-binding protein/permease [Eubacteriales bacterium]